MFGFRWIQMSLFLMLLHLTAVTGQYSASVVQEGDAVTLPCENVTYKQNECENISWLFSGAGNTPSVELVGFGQIGESSKSDRLSVTENCSLAIKAVTVQDVGRYSCRKFKSGQQQGQDVHVYLSVINSHEYENNDMVTFSCSVLTYGWCTQRVKWLFNGTDVDKDIRGVKTSQSYCSTSVTLRTSHYIYATRYGSLWCEATDRFTGKVQRFIFSPQYPGEDATTVRTTERSTKAASANNDTTKAQGWLRFIIVSVGLASLIMIVVAVNMWTKTKGNKTQKDEVFVHSHDDDGKVNYENLGDLEASIRIH